MVILPGWQSHLITLRNFPSSWAVEQVAAELRETYLGVAAAMVLLDRVGAGCPHPALRLARRSGGDALDLAGEVDQQVTDGVRRLRVAAGHVEPDTIGGLVEVLDSVGSRWSAAADRIRQFPAGSPPPASNSATRPPPTGSNFTTRSPPTPHPP
ncbi:hypothetical protein [Micromonospora sp. NBC_00421]|uniref:hypothetical protein n=1 Tax=Micromonospora sp. NBC_00421 TaxID=2975976 RepID=UPI002E1EC932